MAKGNSNAAEELNTAPELEVLDGAVPIDTEDSAMVNPEEITALLEQMAEQNEEKLSAADSLSIEQISTETEALKTEIEGVQEATALSFDSNAVSPTEAPIVVEPPIATPVHSAPVEREAGPSFTIDQVLQAASTSTGFSVDEIKNFEVEEHPTESDSESELENEEVEGDGQLETGDEMLSDGIDGSGESASTQATKVQTPRPAAAKAAAPEKSRSESRAKFPEWAMVVAGVVVSIVGGYFLSNMQAHSLERKISAKVAKLDTSLTELTELVEGTNSRLANLDRSLTTGEPNVHKPEETHTAAKSQEATVPKAAPSHGKVTDAKGTSDHATMPVEKSSTHATNASKHSDASKAEHTKPKVKGDNFNEEALTEGFHSETLLIARRGHSNVKADKPRALRTRTAGVNRRQRSSKAFRKSSTNIAQRNNSVRAYLDDKPVSVGFSSGTK